MSGSVKSTDLHFRGQPVTLKMIQQLWLCQQGESKFGNLRTNFLTDDHFPPRTSFHRMKVFLATQVVSATVIRLIDMHADKCGGNEQYQLIRALLKIIDQLVDISNNTKVNNRGIAKGCEEIDNPNHFHLKELLEILGFFCRMESRIKNKR